ncbi:MAG TPA: hypothetical protein VKU41_21930 [Polyangiaceae bacterium]|nr:hypothetical protein [Polyangiaceae bacterium]
MNRHVVVALRFVPAGIGPRAHGTFLDHARTLCARGEALGGRLVAWSAASFAIAWEADSIEEAVDLATQSGEAAPSSQPCWASGFAEGELEALAPDGQRMHLAWGPPLVAAMALARAANVGEVLVDDGVGAVRDGGLAVRGTRRSVVDGHPVEGWKLDLSRPWRRRQSDGPWSESTERTVAPPAADSRPGPGAADATFDQAESAHVVEELSSEDLLPVLDDEADDDGATSSTRPRVVALVDRVRAVSSRESGGAEALAELRRERARAEAGSPTAHCQTALALALALSFVGRQDEALLEALDALARARDLDDTKAVEACLALLAKLYASAGQDAGAAQLRAAARRS